MKAKTLVLSFLLTALLQQHALALAATRWVNDDDPNGGGYAPPGTSCNNPGYSTIQDAVDAASAGDIIRVCAGVYAEQVVIDKSQITLKGNPGAILDGSTLSPGDGITILGGVSYVTVTGFEIRNYQGTSSGVGNAIQAWNCGTSDIKISKNNMHDNAWNAVLTGNEGEALHSRWNVRENTVANNGFYNIELTNVKNGLIAKNTVNGPGGGDQAIGILVQARSMYKNPDFNYLGCASPLDTIVVNGNNILDNVVSGFKEGTSGGGEGIRLLAASSTSESQATLRDTKVANNSVSDNDRQGIFVFACTNCGPPTFSGTGVVTHSLIYHNRSRDNGRDGIRLLDGDKSSVRSNTVDNNVWHGIRLGSGSTKNNVWNNTSIGNGDGAAFFDLFHDGASSPNSWENNTCGTKSGADIPAC